MATNFPDTSDGCLHRARFFGAFTVSPVAVHPAFVTRPSPGGKPPRLGGLLVGELLISPRQQTCEPHSPGLLTRATGD